MDANRRQIFLNSDRERVEVNQRDLIDKILARYTSKFVIYRELIQNSDDAESSSVQINFETENNEVKQIIFKNDGFPFRNEDWNRLKKIAEGNPDEQKVGAFGVGFYSLFSVCENPIVYSGNKAMAFEWQGNQLFTRQGRLELNDNCTTFLFEMKELIELPDVEEFARFLANSLGFMEHLQKISVYFDGASAIELSKTMDEPESVDITSEFNTFSPQKMFHLTSVSIRNVRLDISFNVRRSTAQQRRLLTEEASISFRIARGNLDVNVSDEFSKKMQQLTKKKPPSETTIQIIFTKFDDTPSESYNESTTSPVFRDLLPYPGQGRIHIGFSTNQTIGCNYHLSARVIPTMERELIDFANTTFAEYNKEMLCLVGTLYRISYENEMSQPIYYSTDNDTREKRAAHVLAHFMFNSSTPNAQVGEIIESLFFSCKRELPILSTKGVLPMSEVRMPDPKMLGFIKTIPIIPKIVFKQCDTFFRKVRDMKLIKELALQDVLDELRNRVLSEDEMIKLLEWWISYNESLKSKGKSVDQTEFKKLACINDRSRSLDTFRYSSNPFIIPPDVDIQARVLPSAISKEFKNEDLKNWLGLPKLSLVAWAKSISRKPNLEADPRFAESVLKILAGGLNWTCNITINSQSDKETIRQLFEQKRCIPTTFGMKLPGEAYFKDVNSLFPDLPTIQFEDLSISDIESLMELLGVRKVVKLNLIIDYLINNKNCDHMQVIRYLASNSGDLKQDETKKLKSRPIWPKKNSGYSPVQHSIICDLYTPLAEHCELGLPVIYWNERWSRNTQEGKFLIKLGIKEYPTLQKILKLAAPPTNTKIRNNALKYFIKNFEGKYSFDYDSANVNAFLPCLDPYTYAKPSECFINIECSVMNFPVVRQDLRYYVERFGVCQHPGREELLNRLAENLPQNEYQAKEIFEYLATRQGRFNTVDWSSI